MSTPTALKRPCNWGDEAGVPTANGVCVCVCVCVCVSVYCVCQYMLRPDCPIRELVAS